LSDFDRVKDALPIKSTILSLTGLSMKGPHLESCPFCGGHGCFSIQEGRGIFHCFQCDDKGGDILTFIERFEKLSTGDALKRGAEMAGISLAPVHAEGKKKSSAQEPPTVKEKIFSAAAEYYHSHMLGNGGREYFMQTRGHAERTLRALMVGWTDGGLYEYLKAEGFPEADILASGLVTERKGQTVDLFFKGLAVYPHFIQGRVAHFTCKDPVQREDGKKYNLQLPKAHRSDSWSFYNQDVLYKRSEVIVVEGENDLQSLMDAGVDNVVGLIGQPSDEQIKTLRTHTSKKHLYLCLDNDEAGINYARKIHKVLDSTDTFLKIMVFEGYKDIDEHLRALDEPARHREVKRLQEDALDPLAWEIYQAARMTDLEAKDKHLREQGVYRSVSEMSDMQLEIYLEKIESLGFSKKAVLKAVEAENDLLDKVQNYVKGLDKGQKPDGVHLGEVIYKWFTARGKFFKTAEGRVYLFYRQRIFELGDNLDYNTMMLKLTRLAPQESPGKLVWHVLRCLCNERGDAVEVMSWLHTNRETDSVYVNLNSPKNTILKLSPGRNPEELMNGTNPEGVLLSSSPKIKPFEYSSDAQPSEAFSAIKSLIFDNLACEKEVRYLILCWLIYFIFIDFNKTRGLMKFTGPAASGKSTAASMLSYLLYAQDLAGQGSAAASFSEGSQLPLLIQDNIENRDLNKNLVNFLLLGANTAPRSKRKGGSDSGVVTEFVKALILITAIEPFPGNLPELISRTYEVTFEKRHQKSGFVEDEAFRGIVKSRNMVLSGLLNIAAKEILPRLAERSAWLSVLQKDYPGHNKARTNEFLSLLLVILESVVKHIPYYDKNHVAYGEGADVKDILDGWIRYQNELAAETGTSGNSILNILDGIIRVVDQEMKTKTDLTHVPHPDFEMEVYEYTHNIYGITMLKSMDQSCTVVDEDGSHPGRMKIFQFEATSAHLHDIINRYCREVGTRNPYENPTVLGCRIKNDLTFIERGGWKVVGKADGQLHFKTVHGLKVYKFRKEVIF